IFLHLLRLCPPPSPSLFPYTTLVRSGLHTGLHLIRGQAGGGLAPFVLLVLPNLPVLRQNQGHHTVLVPDEPFRGALGGHVRSLRSEEHTPELQSRFDLVCRLLLEIKN